MRKIIALCLLVFIGTTTLYAQWSELGGINALSASSTISATCKDAAGNIYAAGAFTNGSTRYVAKFNGTSWSELGGINSLAANNTISSICSDAAGNIYAAGAFTNGSTRYVAKFDGTSWSELGGTDALAANNTINSICSDAAGNIYAVGAFTNASSKRFVAKFDGTNWAELGGFNSLAANNTISSICSDVSGNIYVAGLFTNNFNTRYVAKFNGFSWAELGGFNALSANNTINSICSDASGNIYASGVFTNSNGTKYVAKFNGFNWSELGGFNALAASGNINTICSNAAGNIFAAGAFTNGSFKRYVAKFDGTSWSELGGINALSPSGNINTICSDASGNIYAGGAFLNGSNRRYVAKYTCTPTYSYTNISSCGSYNWNGNLYYTSGTYTKTFAGSSPNGCDSVANLNLTITAANPVGTASLPTLCTNVASNFITHTTSGATGIGTATGLPAGITAAWASNNITLSGTPTATGVFNYSIPLTSGGCSSLYATGSLTVTSTPNITYTNVSSTYKIGTAINSLTPTNTGGVAKQPSNATITTLGSGFNYPTGVAVDALGAVYVADANNNVVKKIVGNTVTTIGSGYNFPSGVAVDATGVVYVADQINNRVKTIYPGTPTGPSSIGFGFSYPGGVAVDASGAVYVADAGNNAIKKVVASFTVTTLGSGFNQPSGVAVDAAGAVYVADVNNNAVKKIIGSTVTTLGSGFNSPLGVAVDAAGAVYVADFGNSAIKKIVGNTVTTLASGLNRPTGVAVDAAGAVYVAEQGNNAIKKFVFATYTISPALPTGLNLDVTTGAITGTPTVATANTTYTISTQNNCGSNTAIISFATVACSPTSSTTNVSICSSALPYSWNGSRASAGTYTYTTTNAQGCDSTATLNLTVNTSPTVNTVSNQTVCAGSNSTAIDFTGTAFGYTWTNSNIAIGLAANGTGNIAAFAATNTTNAPITATITVTPNAQVLASYPLLTNISDATGNFGDVILQGNPTAPATPSTGNSLCTTGIYINGDTGGQDIQTPNIASLNSTNFTISVDFRAASFSTPIIVGGNGWRWIGIYTDASGKIGMMWNDNNFSYSTTTINLNQWYNAKLTFNNNTANLYLDGVLVNTTITGTLTTANNLNFTTTHFGSGSTLNGCIKNLNIYNNPVCLGKPNSFTITVKATSTSTTNTTICANQLPYSWNGSRASAGTYTYTTTNSVGCDSVATLNLTVNQSPVIASLGNALYFSNASYNVNYVSFNSSFNTATNYSTASNFTIESWINPSDNDFRSFFSHKTSGGNADGYALFVNPSGYANKLYLEVANNGFLSTGSLTAGQWNHVALVYAVGIATWYINGVASGSASINITTNGGATLLGVLNGGNYEFNGGMDEVRIWNTIRTQAEIAANMNKELAGNEAGLYAYYNFNQGIAAGNNSGVTTLFDKTANANNGTLNLFSLSGSTSNFVSSYDASVQSACLGSSTTSFSLTVTGATSYQWYSNTTASNIGGSTIGAATSASYTAPTTIAGTQYYYLVATNASGCSAVSSVQTLTVKANSTSTTNVSICPSALPYSWNGTTYNAAGTYTQTLVNAAGCDSLATLILDIKTNYSITASAGANGSISPSGSTSVCENENQTYTITAAIGYSIADVLVDGISVGNLSSYTFFNTNSAHTISATFKAQCNLPILAATGISSSGRAPNLRFRRNLAHYLITSNECAAMGLIAGQPITNIGWENSTAPTTAQSVALKLYLQNSNDSSNNKSSTWSTAISTMTLVHNTTAHTIPADVNDDITTFSGTGTSAFIYTGGSIYVAYDMSNCTNTLSTSQIIACNTSLINGLKSYQNATNCNTSSTLTSNGFRPATHIRLKTSSITIQTACKHFLWNGVDYTTSGQYTWTGFNAAGCDSVATLNLTVNQTPVIASAAGNALNFTANNTVVYNQPFTTATDNFTLETWVNWNGQITTQNGGWAMVLNNGNAFAPHSGYGFQINTNNGKVGFVMAGIAGADCSVITPNTWYHLALVRKNGVATLFVNGVPDANVLNDGPYTPATTSQMGLFGFGGSLDEVRMWNVAKTQAEIQAAMNTTLQGNEANLAAYYNFNQGIAAGNNSGVTTLLDGTANANNGTLNNFTLSGTTSNFVSSFGSSSNSVQSVCLGSAASINPTVTGATGYQWYSNTTANNTSGSPISAATSATYTAPTTTVGTQYYYLIATNASGCSATSSIQAVTVKAASTSTSTTNLSVCSSALPYSWNGLTFTAAGSQTATLTSATGCDSMATLVLTVNEPTNSFTTLNICSNKLPYNWNGGYYNYSGIYYFYSTNAAGCDSIATLDLTVNEPTNLYTRVEICSNQGPYYWNGINYYFSGIYYFYSTNAAGCDNVETLNLTVNQSTISFTAVYTCVAALPYNWNGVNYYNGGTYYIYPLTNAVGCDSVARLDLIVNPTYSITASAGSNGSISNSGAVGVCLGNNSDVYVITPNAGYYIVDVLIDGISAGAITSYSFNNVNTNHTISASFALSCSPSTSSTTYTACGSYLWNGVTYTTSGTYNKTFTGGNSEGCDSTATLNLTINTATTSTNNATACGSYLWNGVTYSTSGVKIKTFTAGNSKGCDSTATLNLTINTATTSSSNASICSNQLPYSWNGLTFTAAGTQTAHLTNSKGCDSAATLILSVASSSASTIAITSSTNNICSGVNVTFTATVSNEGVSPIYQWKKNGITVGNNSNTYSSTTLANNDTVWCVLTSNSVCATSLTATSNKIKVIVNALPVTGTSTAVTLCTIGGTINLYNTVGGGFWSSSNPNVVAVSTVTNSSTGLAKAIANGTATISYTITNSTGCSTVTTSTALVASVPVPAAITGATSVCIGGNITLSNSTPGGVWSSIAGRATIISGGIVTGTSAGVASIKYTVTNSSGCNNSTSYNLTVNSVPNIPSIGYAAGTVNPQTGPGGAFCTNRTFTLVGTPSGGTWSKTGVLSVNATSGVVTTGSTTGAGSIIYTIGTLGCTSIRTIVGSVAVCAARGVNGGNNGQLSAAADDNGQWTMYPNPAHSFISLNVNTLIGSGSIVITDVYGKQVKTQSLSMGINTINVSSFAKGIYLVSMITNEGKTTNKLVVE